MRTNDTTTHVRRRPGSALGALLVGAALSVALAAASVDRLSTLLALQRDAWRVDVAVEAAVTAAGALVASWLAVSALITATCIGARLAGARWRAGERLVQRWAPAIVRKALVVAVGASVGLGLASGASAAAPSRARRTPWRWTTSAGWRPPRAPRPRSVPPSGPRPLPPQPPPASVAPSAGMPASVAPPPTPAAVAPSPSGLPTSSVDQVADAASVPPVGQSAPSTSVVVAPGDSLWAIAARHLPPGATDAEIAAAWPRWYEANAATIGADPDVIRPGQVLVVPTTVAGASS